MASYAQKMQALIRQGDALNVNKYKGNSGSDRVGIDLLIDSAVHALNAKFPNDPYPAMEIGNFRHRLKRNYNEANTIFLLKKNQAWNELHISWVSYEPPFEASRLMKLTYETGRGWTASSNLGSCISLAIHTHIQNRDEKKANARINKTHYSDDSNKLGVDRNRYDLYKD